jgi:protein-S-isoprenylcysteine O-methyltransferase Ste14
MYIGVLMIILGWAAFFISYATLLYLALVWVVFQCFIMFIEEPVLHRKFGNSYKNYCKQVKRWIPIKGYNK